MAPSDWSRLSQTRGLRRRLGIMCGHVIRRPVLILTLVGLALVITRFGKDFPLLYGTVPVGAVVIRWSMGGYRPVDSAPDDGNELVPQGPGVNGPAAGPADRP
ncbi:hypothetical protein ABZ721_31285 [Streptomyces sp. NPDC006733]|uniref:hypothetical protein n=1 Tax=Streptomyces sp. NPDC006733 TaxID=3155460 RepID=UPI0033CC661B